MVFLVRCNNSRQKKNGQVPRKTGRCKMQQVGFKPNKIMIYNIKEKQAIP